MGTFKPYLLGSVVFAVVLTALAINKDIASFIGQFDVLVFVPVMTAILVSGNVHMPSEFGAYLEFFIQWFVVGIAVGAVIWVLRRRKTDAAT